MAKVIKTAALVVGAVALVATGVGAIGLAGIAGAASVAGISASTLFLVAGGLSVAGSLLTKQPSVPSSMGDRLNATIDPKAFRKTWLGSTAGPVDVRYVEWFGNDQERCGWIVAHASHAIEGVDEIWFDDELAWTATGGTQGKYSGYFWVRYQTLEGSAANVTSFGSGKWNGSHRLTGCAWSLFEFKVTGNSKKAESPFSGGLPSRVTIIGRGGKLYDPRRDSTIPGGNGPMRVDNQSTWRYVADDGATIGENLALHALRVVLGWRINGLLATGSGVPGRKINLASWITAANLCDEQVNRSAGGTEPRYHGAGVISEGDDVSSVLDMLCAACCGRFTDTNGRLGFAISHNDLATIATDDGLNDDDVIGQFSWDPDPGTDVPNVVSGKFTDPSNASLYQLVPYPDVRIDSADGIERPQPIDLAWVESSSQAQRIVKQVLQRAQYNRIFRSTFDIRAWKYGVGDPFPFTFAPLGFVRVPFRVIEQDVGPDGTCLMALRFETPAVFAWDADDAAAVQAAAPIVYDSRNNPLIRGISEAGGTAEWSGVYGEGKPEDNATVGAGDDDPVGGATAKDVINALKALGPVADPTQILASAQALVDRVFGQALAIHDAQLLGEERKARWEALLHLDGAQLNTRVRQEISERIEGDTAIVSRVDEIEASATDGLDAAMAAISLEQQVRASSVEAETLSRNLAISLLRSDIGGDITDVEALVLQEVQTRVSAIAAEAVAREALRVSLAGDIADVDAAVVNERLARISAIEAEAIAREAVRAALAGDIGDVAAAVVGETAARVSALAAEATAREALRVSLAGDIADVDAAVVNERLARISAIEAEASARQALAATFDGVVSAAVDEEAVVRASQTAALAAQYDSLSTTLDGHTASITNMSESIDGVLLKHGFLLNSNGHAIGMIANNNGDVGGLDFVADYLRVWDASGTISKAVFAIEGGVVKMHDVEVDRLKVGSMDYEFTLKQEISATQGSQMLPGGVVMKWGAYRALINNEVQLSIVFDDPFPNECQSFVPIPYLNTFSVLRDLWLQNIGTKTRFGVSVGTQSSTSNDQRIDGFDWIAFGK